MGSAASASHPPQGRETMIKHPHWQHPLTGAPHSLISFLIIALLFLLLFLVLPLSLSPQGTINAPNKVTAVVVTILSTDVAYTDKVKISFSARITSQSKGAVDFRWFRSDGGRGQQERITFSKGGDLSVTSTWTLGAAAAGRQIWEAVEILYPNHMESNKAQCTVPAPRAASGGEPVRINVSLVNMSAGQSFQCSNKPNTMDPTQMYLWGRAKIKNNSNRTLMLREHLPNYTNSYFFVALLFPLRKEVVATQPIWPRTYNDPNWGAYELSYPDTLASNAEYVAELQRCYPCFDKHPIIYVGAIYTDPATGQKTASNLVKWEEHW
jgi:hypothetical protein